MLESIMAKILSIIVMLAVLVPAGYCGEIHNVIEEGNLDQVKELLESNPDLINATYNYGQSVMHAAAYSGHIEIVKYLIEKGADVNARSGQNSNPLHGAAYYGHEDIVKLLIENGAEVDNPNAYDYRPMLSACAGGHLNIVKMLIDAGADIEATTYDGANALLTAAASGNQEMFEMLLELGADLNSVNNDGDNALHYAAVSPNSDFVRYLIDKGFDINSVNHQGEPPIHSACYTGRLENVKLLNSLGADINTTDSSNQGIFVKTIYSAYRGVNDTLLALMDYLIENGADVNSRDHHGITPLMRAIHVENAEILDKVIEAGADVNAVDEHGLPAIVRAIDDGHPGITGYLIEKGARVDIREKYWGNTPLHRAAIAGNREIMEALIPAEIDINIKNDKGYTPLHCANRYGNRQVADLLLSNGAVTGNGETNFGWSPYLFEEVNAGEAVLWHLGHCGWAIKTRNHLLIFDYWSRGPVPSDPCLANGHINPAEIYNQNVDVFITHAHQDHYDSTIFKWENELKDLTYIFGFKPEDLPESQNMQYAGQEYIYAPPRWHDIVDGMEVMTIESNDEGVGYLIKVDGLTIYHAGDHGGWVESEKEGFTREVDHLAEYTDGVDFAFVNVTGCHHQDTTALAEGTFYTIDRLSPQIVIPTHGMFREHVYENYAKKIKEKGYDVNVLCACFRGDRYIYREGKIL
ncbi:MAG: hypothetical protein GF307_12155 [candidate division Zixibacteria bacterium]|nr:hypothetical protein [candidate division Zixibacteria bacterium]